MHLPGEARRNQGEGSTMNGYDRVVAALEHREPDRVPIMEFSVHPRVIEALCPGGDYLDLVEQLDLDGAAAGSGHMPTHATSDAQVYEDRWGTVWKRGEEAYYPTDGPIKSLEDLANYEPPDPYADDLLANLRKLVERFKGERFIDYHTRSDFMSAADLRGFAELLVDFVEDPELVHGITELVSDFYCTLARRAIEAGADAISLGDDWAGTSGPFMSPAHFREFVLPYFKRSVQTCKDAGAYVIKHCDGMLWPLMDMVVEAGIDAINPIQPDAGMDIGEMKRRYGDRVCLAGNIDCGYVLSTGPVEEVVQEVKQAIRKAGPGGGYIVMSSNSIHSSVKPENYKAMVEAARTYGRYPIQL